MKVLFGEWTFDVQTHQLRRGAEEVHLSTKAFELLKLLIDARPRVLSKVELQEALWRDVFVSETNLFTLISEIRSAIGDDARRARFVRTVHGVGYAFSGHAAEVDDREVASPSSASAFSVAWADNCVRLSHGENVLGRDTDLALRLESPAVSRRHARIIVAGDTAVLEDLRSKNGTYLNSRRIESPAPLKNGDQIRIGSLVCTFRAYLPVTSTKTQKL